MTDEMPLITIQEIQSASPLFHSAAGRLFARFLMRILSVDRLNELYDRYADIKGPEFARAVLKDIGVRYEIENLQMIDSLPDGPFITISNHPYGSIDGVMLVDLFGHLRPDYKVMVNSLLSRIKTLEDSFICVTPVGNVRNAPSKDSIQGIRDAMRHVREGHPLGIFPSGAVSDLSLKDRCIRDREWQEPVIRLIRKLNVPIIPIRFLDRNSDFYYSLGLIDWKVRLLRLPAEVFNKKGRKTRIAFGDIITPQEQEAFSNLDEFRSFLRSRVYGIKTDIYGK